MRNTNNNARRQGGRPQFSEGKRTPFRRPASNRPARQSRRDAEAPFSERAELSSPDRAFLEMEADQDGYQGFGQHHLALDILDRARKQKQPADLPTENCRKPWPRPDSAPVGKWKR